MDEQVFWPLLEDAKCDATDDQHLVEMLTTKLTELPGKELFEYHDLYLRFIDAADKWPLWDAIYLINGGCGDDSWFDFRDFLISRGQTIYERTVSDPESLLDDKLDKYNEWPFGEYHYHSAAEAAYRIKLGRPDDYEISIPMNFKWSETAGQRIDTESESDIKKHFPRIWDWQQTLKDV